MAQPYATQWGIVPQGTKLFVESVDADTGTVWLFAEGAEPALRYWDNLLVIVPFDTEDLVSCLRLPVDKMLNIRSQSETTGRPPCSTI